MKMTKRSLLALILLLVLCFSLIACSGPSYNYGGDMTPDEGAPGAGNGYGGGLGSDTSDTEGTLDGAVTDRKIIKTVDEYIETQEYDAFVEKLKAAVEKTGGYFVSSNYRGNGVEDGSSRNAYFEIRIPAEKLSAFTSDIGALGTVVSYRETASDVTLSYVDIESRIIVLEAEEVALLAILANASTTSDILAVRSSLSDTQGQLASLRAQKKSYDTLVAYSTVYLNVDEVVHERNDDGSFFAEVGNEFMASLSGVGRFFRSLAVFILGSSPVLVLLALIGVCGFFIVRALFRRESKKLQEMPLPASKTDATPKDDASSEK